MPTSDKPISPIDRDTPPEPSRQRNLLRRLRRFAYRKFPALFPDPDYRNRIAIWRSRDKKENAESAPPKDELIDLRCIWDVEFYTPSHIEKLLEGFLALGWNKDEEPFAAANPSTWVRQWRETAHGGGWLNLGRIDRPGIKRSFPGTRIAPLPEHIEFAIGSMYGLTSSITCIVIAFVFDEENSRCFDRVLRQEYETYSEPRGRGYRIHGPFNQKRAAVEEIRREMRATTGEWFRSYLPGLLSSKMVGEPATCEFITLRKGVPFPRIEEVEKVGQYLALLDLAYDHNAWKSSSVPGLAFTSHILSERVSGFHAIVAMNENAIDPERLRIFGGPNRSSTLHIVDEYVHGLLSRWALSAVLSGFERQLNAIRDSAS